MAGAVDHDAGKRLKRASEHNPCGEGACPLATKVLCLVQWGNIIQSAVDCQVGQHDYLLDTQQHAALGAVQKRGEIAGHDTRRGQRFTGVGQ